MIYKEECSRIFTAACLWYGRNLKVHKENVPVLWNTMQQWKECTRFSWANTEISPKHIVKWKKQVAGCYVQFDPNHVKEGKRMQYIYFHMYKYTCILICGTPMWRDAHQNREVVSNLGGLARTQGRQKGIKIGEPWFSLLSKSVTMKMYLYLIPNFEI